MGEQTMVQKPVARGIGRRSWVVIMGGILFAISLYFYTAQPGGGTVLKYFSDLAPIIVSAWALTMALLLFSQTRASDRIVWLLLGLGLFFDFSGETVWAVYELILNVEVPYPSLADIGWVLAYPLFFLGLLRQLRLVRLDLRWQEWSILTGSSIAGLLLLFFIGHPILRSGEITWIEKLLGIYYPLGGFVNSILALVMIILFGRGLLEEGWLFISLSYLLSAIGDTAYAYLTFRELYPVVGDICSDLSWILGYILIAVGLSLIRFRTE